MMVKLSHYLRGVKMNDEGVALDLTATQFSDLPDYSSAKRRAFLTKTPSKRTLVVIDRVKGLL